MWCLFRVCRQATETATMGMTLRSLSSIDHIHRPKPLMVGSLPQAEADDDLANPPPVMRGAAGPSERSRHHTPQRSSAGRGQKAATRPTLRRFESRAARRAPRRVPRDGDKMGPGRSAPPMTLGPSASGSRFPWSSRGTIVSSTSSIHTIRPGVLTGRTPVSISAPVGRQ